MHRAEEIVQVVPLLGVRRLERRAFDYRVPAAERGHVVVGSVVWIPFRRREVRGVVVAVGASGEVVSEKALSLRRVTPEVIPADMVRLAERLSAEYLAPLGACLQAVAPPVTRRERRGAEERVVRWMTPVAAAPPGVRLTAKQEAVLAAVPPEGAPLAEICRRAGVSRTVVAALVEKGLLERGQAHAAAGPSVSAGWVPPAAAAGDGPRLPVLNEEQRRAVRTLQAALAASGPQRVLLWGVTGSGKTEVYVRLLETVVAGGGSALVLVPEIALTVQLLTRLRLRLGDLLAVVHSGLPASLRAAEYRRIAAGEARVVVGARSAVLAPVRDLRLVVIDEAHDASYKQEEEPRYDARLVAWWRVEEAGGLLVEGTATPRVECLAETPQRVRLRTRAGEGSLPSVDVVDMRREGGGSVLAPRVRQELDRVLARGEQAILLLNRRGYAGFMRCDVCGEVLMCPRCELSLTYHRSRRGLLCHYCGYQTALPAVCPACHTGTLGRGSPGTERVVDEVRRLVPRDRLFRLDSDIVTSGARVHDVLGAFAAARPGVLVGTQMVAKGHDFPLVTLVVVADADTGLYLSDFRAGERTFQLLTQVAGRAGRADRPGRVLVQSWNPDVDCIRMAVAGEVETFYRQELELRERLGYPPYRRLVRLVLACRYEERAEAGARYLVERLQGHLAGDELRGPARLPTLRGVGRWQVLIAGRDPERGLRLAERAVHSLRVPYARRGVDLLVDVDPQWFL
ncbi:MAG: primosomal protein N' [Actinobacteria bacterium]|nr:primosomal protein N' [Actinomycetota bacterium]